MFQKQPLKARNLNVDGIRGEIHITKRDPNYISESNDVDFWHFDNISAKDVQICVFPRPEDPELYISVFVEEGHCNLLLV